MATLLGLRFAFGELLGVSPGRAVLTIRGEDIDVLDIIESSGSVSEAEARIMERIDRLLGSPRRAPKEE